MSERGNPASQTEDEDLGTQNEEVEGTDVVEETASEGGGDDPVEGEESLEDDGEEGQEGDVRQVGKPVSRATRRVLGALEQAKAAKAEAEAARREAAELRARIEGRQTEQEAALERERVALMTPEERADHRLQKLEQSNAQFMQRQNLQLADINDRSAFSTLCARSTTEGKLYASVADEVEEQLAEARRAGINPQRQVIAERILGQRMLKRALGAKPRQEKRGAERVAQQTVRAPGGGSNVRAGAQRTSDAAARAKRLENLEL